MTALDDLDNLGQPELYEAAPETSPEDQRVVLFNTCNVNTSPTCEFPGFRIVGFFHDKDEAAKKVKRIQRTLDDDEDIHFWTTPAFEPFLICKDTARMTNGQYRHNKVNEIVQVRNEYLRSRKSEFEDHRNYVYDPETEKKRKDTSARLKNPFRQTDATQKPRRKKVSARKKAIEAVKGKQEEMMRDYPREHEVRDQEFAAISWLKDVTPDVLRGKDDQEPVVWIYRCFQTEEDAIKWVNEVAMNEIDDPPVEIVRMYGWLFPTKVDYSKVNDVYANQELNTYMQTLRKEQKETHSFEKFCLEQNIPLPTVSIEELNAGTYEKPQMEVDMFDSKDSQIPNDEAVYIPVAPMSEQTEDVVRLRPQKTQGQKRVGKAVVANRKL